MMKTASVAEMKVRLGAWLKAAEAGPVVVTRKGKAVAVLVGVHDDDEAERLVMAHSPKLRAILEKSRQQIRAGQGIPHDQFWREVEAETAARAAKSNGRKKTSKS
jgi:prevent-host-death family protein